jgi:uncharacterized secreted repeat protein (TIGR03808 family)
MNLDRRRLFAALAGAASAGAAMPARAREVSPPSETQSVPRAAIDATSLGLQPNAVEDQSTAFQRAIDHAAAARSVLQLPPGFFRAGALRLPPYAAIAGVPGATRIVMAGGQSMLWATGSDHLSLSGLILDGVGIPLPEQRGLVHLSQGRAVRIADCEIVNSGRNGITLEAIEGAVTGNTVNAADFAVMSIDAGGLRIAGNTVQSAGNGGIFVWRTKAGDDGTLIIDNRIENVANKSGGTGQWGNGISMFRADNVIVRGNRIRNTAYSAVRGNSSSNLQIVGNTCTGLGEVAIYSEFAFQGAVIANNIVDGAAVGVSVANPEVGGRLAVVQGNLLRNLVRGRPPGGDQSDLDALGIGIEADTVVNGNVVENVEGVGILVGWGDYLRDVAVSANVVRGAEYGIGVTVVPGAGTAMITDNLISEARLGAIVGMEWKKLVAADLSKGAADRYAQLSIAGNRVR